MEFPVITSDEHYSDAVRERLLLHWVNSLPLTKCLLVEELRDLRFGDVLLDIVSWLQRSTAAKSGDGTTEDVFEKGEIKERLRRVVQFAASACRSQDGDAMYIVNDSESVTRVMAGQSDAICAVLTVLKRLGIQRLREQQSFENDKSAIRRLQVQEEMMKHSLHANGNADKLGVKVTEVVHNAKQLQSSSSRSQSGSHHLNTKKLSKGIQDTGARTTKNKETKRTRKRPTVIPKRKLKDKDPPSNATANSSSINDKKSGSSQTGIYHDEKGLRVYGMLDPTAKYQSRGETFDSKCDGCPSSDDEVAVRICNWIQLVLQIEIDTNQIFIKDPDKWRLGPPRKVRQVFANGVLLGRIADAIIQRCGKQLINQNVPEAKDLGVGASTSLNDPQTPAERRRKLTLALTAFKSLGISSEALTAFESSHFSGTVSPKSIWSALDEVFNRVERLAHAAAPITTQHSEHSIETSRISTYQGKTTAIKAGIQATSSLKLVSSPQLRREKSVAVEAVSAGCVPLKRNMPYISSEQIQVVNEWLTRVGFDLKKFSGRGVLQDPMRNGVLLWYFRSQHAQHVNSVLKMGSFPFYKRPQTLSDMRENISAAFEKLGNYLHEQTPQCYLTSSAEQAVLIGDRQISYGLLWHIWQASHKTRVVGPNKGSSPKGIHETRDVETAKRWTPVNPSPLLLDIPAVALAEQGKLTMKSDVKTHIQVELHDSFARRLAWDENDPSGDHDGDDVFPVPRAPFSSPVYNTACHLESALSQTEDEEKFDTSDDILPIHSQQRTTCISSPSQDKDTRAPRIGIEELSAAVVAPVTSTNLSTSGSHGIAVMPTPDIQIKAQGEQNSTPAQESVEEILAWLKRLGIHLKTASSFHDASAKLSEFQSGVLLCSIVEKVELMRCIPGITRPSGKTQLSKASSLHNISKALGILQQKKAIPLHLLRRANAIYAGDRDVILQLLLHTRKAYGHHHTLRRRSSPHSSAA